MNKLRLKSHFVQGIIGLLVVLATLMPVDAQSDVKVRVSVPFDFIVDHDRLPAGDYSLRRYTTAPGVLMIRNDGDGMRSMFMAVSAESPIPLGHARLVFNRYGDQYFLHQIWTGVNYYELPKSRTERWIEKDLSVGDLKRIEVVPIGISPQ